MGVEQAMTVKLAALREQEIKFELRVGADVEFEDGLAGVVVNKVPKITPKARGVIHTIKLTNGQWRAAVKIYRVN